MEALNKSAPLRNILLLALLTWLLTTTAYHGAVNPTGGITGVDFRVFYEAAERLNKGVTLYQTNRDLYAYSPLFALLMRPLAYMPYEKAVSFWFFINAAALLLSILFYANAARLTFRDVVPLGLILLVSFRFWPTTMNFGLGQANFLLLALLTAMYWADSRKKMTAFALLITAAALIKVWALGLILYLLLKRQWKPALLSAAAYAAALAALFSMIGWREWPLFLRAGIASAKQIADHRIRQSIVGFADLHFRTNPLIHPLVDSRFLFYLFVLVSGVAVGAMLVSLWRAAPDDCLYRLRLNFGLVIVSVLLLLPSFEDEYIVLCLPLLWTLLLAPAAGEDQKPSWTLPCSLLVYLALSRGWPVYPPIAAAYQQGMPSLLVSMDYFGVSALWLTGLLALLNQSRSYHLPKLEASIPAVLPPVNGINPTGIAAFGKTNWGILKPQDRTVL